MTLDMERIDPLCFHKYLEFVQLFDEDLERNYNVHSCYYQSLLRDFYDKIQVKESEKTASLCCEFASLMCILECLDTSEDQTCGALLQMNSKLQNLNQETSVLRQYLSSQQPALEESERLCKRLTQLSTEARLKPEFIRTELMALKNIQVRYSNIKEVVEKIQPPSENKNDIPSLAELKDLQERIVTLKERKRQVNANLSRYMGLATDTQHAKVQLEQALAKLNSLDEQLVDTIGMNAWS
ncbi:hypothetical protein FGIG_11136 [Fasciola gigantica]|uniref:Uncharacterized protein n=1 Tax=Fasciola gigantica TaxID=46835 RepID=A0A504YW57_FASGI|nr:hypothetical protein FGIG_11136 [Fasciola gigantica]